MPDTKPKTPAPAARHRLALLAAAAAICCRIPARAAEFTVLDERAPQETSEITRLYVDGALIASFELDHTSTGKRVPVRVSDTNTGPAHDYALCGEITFRAADGSIQVHRVSGQGTLPAPDGHVFLALGSNDFTRFFLADPTDPTAVQPRFGPSPLCEGPIS